MRGASTRQVAFLDLAASHRELAAEIEAAALRVLRSGRYVLGPELEAFEAAFAARLGSRHCVGVGNGLDALRMTLQALGIGPGDEVVVPGHTYIATWFAVSGSGARPVPADVDAATYQVSPESVEAAITARTRAIIPVHLYGHPAPMAAILAIARRHGLAVLEDAAQAHGTELDARPAGAWGDAAGWSFYPVKNLGAAGDGGAVTTNDDQLARRVRLLRNQGASARSVHEVVGSNSRLDELQAAILRVKLGHLDRWVTRRRQIASEYLGGLAMTGLGLPATAPGAAPAWHQFVVRHPRRADLASTLRAAGVETLIHYETPPHLQPAYESLGLRPGSLTVTERLAREVLSLPIDPGLDAGAVDRVIGAVARWDRATEAAA